MRLSLFCVLVVCLVWLAGCAGPPDDSVENLADANEDDAGQEEDVDDSETESRDCRRGLPGPACCEDQGEGNRTSSASCVEGTWQCPGAEDGTDLCRCEDEAVTFVCTNACGSDAFVDSECVDDGWQCTGSIGSVRTSDCPEDTCWGFPGEGCVCDDGEWNCD